MARGSPMWINWLIPRVYRYQVSRNPINREILEKVMTFIQVGNNKKFTDEILILLTQDPGTFASVNYDTHHGWCSSSLEHSNNSLDIHANPPNPPNPK